MSGIMLINYRTGIRDKDFDTQDKVQFAMKAAALDWENYSRLRGYFPTTKPVIGVETALFHMDGQPDHVLVVEGWCEVYNEPGMPPLLNHGDYITAEDFEQPALQLIAG